MRSLLSRRFSRSSLAARWAAMVAVATLLATLVLALAAHQGQRQLLAAAGDDMGGLLAARLADSAARPLLQGDRVSLQAMLADMVRRPPVTRVVVTDLSGRVIAEAGSSQAPGQDHVATVTWQDSVGGQIQLRLDPAGLAAAATPAWQLLALGGLLAALAFILALWPGRALEQRLRDAARWLRGELDVLPDYPVQDALGELLQEVRERPGKLAGVTGAILLHATPASVRLAERMKAICGLYGGEVSWTRGEALTARFDGADAGGERLFQALCCARLLRQLPGEESLCLALGLSEDADDAAAEQGLIDRLQLLCGHGPGILLQPSLAVAPALAGRCELRQQAQGVELVELGAPYRELLQRQLDTLLS